MSGEDIVTLQNVYNSLNEYLHSNNADVKRIEDALKSIQHLLQLRGIFVS